MLDVPATLAGFRQLAPDQLGKSLETFLPKGATREEKIRAIEDGLNSPIGQALRETMARWIVDEIVPVEALVPEAYLNWRLPVSDSMVFVVTHLSAGRLAPKLLEQMELPIHTPAETRLLHLIAKVPGLQKLGQVIARNQHLRPALRKALTKLENGIRDVTPEEVRAIVEKELGSRMHKFSVEVGTTILKEASVSAVIRFSWRNPGTGRRERGVFKVLKPHIPGYFTEDMEYLQGLAQYFGDRQNTYGLAPHVIPDTFRKVRRLLRHEVNFRREQKTLVEAAALYQRFPKVRVPQLIRPLCTPRITALSEESGTKITTAVARLPVRRRRQMAKQLLEALIAVPLFSAAPEAVFHGDPHAGNLMYNSKTGELVILDWALRERLDREQRRHLALLFLMVGLRDPIGVSNEIVALSQESNRTPSARLRVIHEDVREFLGQIAPSSIPSAADAMRLLEKVALKGIKFPVSMIMLSKVVLTLDGILGDMVGADSALGFAIARQVARHWLGDRPAYRSPISGRDWLSLQCSALLLPSRLGIQMEQAMLNRLLRRDTTAP
ncbi:MAG: AarF/UbiB family protein [Candidatus Sulfotelmatobacter sp.]